MSSHGPGIWITGPSRSGTSLVAGLFAAHGVFFGNTTPPDKHNEKGYFEHPELIVRQNNPEMDGWPDRWWEVLQEEGWTPGTFWGVKRGPRAWPLISELEPVLVVVCKRPLKQQIRSRHRRWPNRDGRHKKMAQETTAELRLVLKKVKAPVVTVATHRLVKGRKSGIQKAFDALGLEFSPEIAREWIDPTIWNRGMRK